MGQLFDGRSKLDQIIHERKLDQTEVYGKIGLKAGFLISSIKAQTADDDVKLQKLRLAVQEIVHVEL